MSELSVLPAATARLGITRQERRTGERIMIAILAGCALVSIAVTVAIVFVLVVEAVQFFRAISPWDYLTGTRWAPIGGRVDAGDFGVLPLINGTLLITAGALGVGVPLGLATAIYLSEYAKPRVRSILKPMLELLAGIPTVVIGFFALNFITPNVLRALFGDERVAIFNAAAGAIGVGLMVVPIIASISEDAMRAVPVALREAAYGMGAPKRTVALRVVVPAALSGIAASILLGASRAAGETMVVAIAAGNSPRLGFDYFESIQTLTAFVAQTVSGETPAGTVRFYSLFAVGTTLFVITLVMNLVSIRIVRRFRQVYQ